MEWSEREGELERKRGMGERKLGESKRQCVYVFVCLEDRG